MNNTRNTWKIIKTIISAKNITTAIPHLIEFNSRAITEPTAMSNFFSKYFISTAEKAKSNIKLLPKHYTGYLSTKWNLNQNINDSKSHIWNYFFENIISGVQLFYISPYVLRFLYSYTRFFFFNIRFSRKMSQSHQKIAKNDHSFCNTVLLKKPTNMFLFGVMKNICITLFLDAQELHCWSISKANICIFVYIFTWKLFFDRPNSIYRRQ